MNEDIRKIKLLLIFIAFVLILSAWNDRYNTNSVRLTMQAEIQNLKPFESNGKTYYITIPE